MVFLSFTASSCRTVVCCVGNFGEPLMEGSICRVLLINKGYIRVMSTGSIGCESVNFSTSSVVFLMSFSKFTSLNNCKPTVICSSKHAGFIIHLLAPLHWGINCLCVLTLGARHHLKSSPIFTTFLGVIFYYAFVRYKIGSYNFKVSYALIFQPKLLVMTIFAAVT